MPFSNCNHRLVYFRKWHIQKEIDITNFISLSDNIDATLNFQCFKRSSFYFEIFVIYYLKNASSLLDDGEWKVTKRDLVVASTRYHRARMLKYYPRPSCAPILVKSRMIRPLPIHFLHFQQIFFVLVCIRAGNLRVPPVVLASEPNPAGAITRGVLSFWPCRGNKRLVKKKFSLPKFSFKDGFKSLINKDS